MAGQPFNLRSVTERILTTPTPVIVDEATPSTIQVLPVLEPEQLRERLRRLRPWRMSIQVSDQVCTSEFLELQGHLPGQCRAKRDQARQHFLRLIDRLYPHGLLNKRFLDCGCNAGGYCFWARERKAELSFGFDVREHWIKQARIVKYFRNVAPTDRIQFELFNLYELHGWDLDPFDIVYFKGLFHYLSDPLYGLKLAADLSRDLLVFSTMTLWNQADGSLVMQRCDQDRLHTGIDNIGWYPTGTQVCTEMIRQLGFEHIKITSYKPVRSRPGKGRLEIVAARELGRLNGLPGRAG